MFYSTRLRHHLLTEMGITIGRHHFKDTVINGQERYIEGTTTEIKYQDVPFSLLFIHTIGNGSSGTVDCDKKKKNRTVTIDCKSFLSLFFN